MRFTVLAVAVVLFLSAGLLTASELVLDHDRSAMNLAGQWQLLAENGDKSVWDSNIADTLTPWQPVSVPATQHLPEMDDISRENRGKFIKEVNCVWLRRSFRLSDDQAAKSVVLKWNAVRFGAKAWINGQLVAENATMGPHTALVPAGILKAGQNEIVMKVSGYGGLEKSASGYPLIPAGAATQSWGGKAPAVYQDIWLEFYSDVYAKWVLAMSDLEKSQINFRIWPDSTEAMPQQLDVTVKIYDVKNRSYIGQVAASVKTPAAGGFFDILCPVENFQPWSPENPHTYRATVEISANGKPCDKVEFTTAMREIKIVDGRFSLNGKPLWLRGSNLVNEWLWGDKYNQNIRQYIVDEARVMSLNCFRTHTQPPPAEWLDVADEYGTMILAEMPLLYNHADFGYSEKEYEILHKNALADATGWMTRMWNHPAIVVWVLSNESKHDNQWESTALYDHAKSLDPTRPYMRTGEEKIGTPDILDIHTCFNINCSPEGNLIQHMGEFMAAQSANKTRAITNTEYMNHFGLPARRWLGKKNHGDWPMALAEFATEHTEAMRRLQFDCLLPYMYAGWTALRGNEWRADYPTPMAAALHSAMSPILASWDTFDRNYRPEGVLTTKIALINETGKSMITSMELYITPVDPQFVPRQQALDAAIWHNSIPLRLAANSFRWYHVELELPKENGNFYLAAVMEGPDGRKVVSQRTLRLVDPYPQLKKLQERRVTVFGGDKDLTTWMDELKIQHTASTTDKIDADVAVVWNNFTAANASDQQIASLKEYLAAGGKVVVLDRDSWDLSELADCVIGRKQYELHDKSIGSRAFAVEDASHPMTRDIDPQWLMRWNGLPGTIADNFLLDSPARQNSQELLWVSQPEHIAAMRLPVGDRGGEILFCQLKISERYNVFASEHYDPVAERIFINLLTY